ncbi:MAG: trypsin-like serine peptidase [Panacagrimonas sp.]
MKLLTPICAVWLTTISLFAQAQTQDTFLDSSAFYSVSPGALAQAQQALAAEEANLPTVAIPVSVDVGLEHGQWTDQGDVATWSLRLYSAGATLLIPAFDRFNLPQGASLSVASANGDMMHGPYDRSHQKRHGGLSLPYVAGDTLVLHLSVPANAKSEVMLHLNRLGHGVRPLDSSGWPVAKAAPCEIHVACPQGDGWRDQIRSVVKLQVERRNSFVFCTGQLINNTAQDGAPYILTARHCNITAANDDDVVVFFNFQSSSCALDDFNQGQSSPGTLFLDSFSRSDMTLLVLDENLGRFNAFLSGFNASSGDVPQNGVSIHHPGGEQKRISVFNGGVFKTPVDIVGDGLLSNFTVDAFSVDWEQGVTEQGSSGAGLWDQNKQLVGTLSGGSATCLGGEDFYGRLELAWDDGLSGFLDPLSTGRRSFCGRNFSGPTCNPIAPPASGSNGSGNPGTSSNSSGGGSVPHSSLCLLLVMGIIAMARRRSVAGTI